MQRPSEHRSVRRVQLRLVNCISTLCSLTCCYCLLFFCSVPRLSNLSDFQGHQDHVQHVTSKLGKREVLNEPSTHFTPSCLENGKEHVGRSGEGCRLPLPQVERWQGKEFEFTPSHSPPTSTSGSVSSLFGLQSTQDMLVAPILVKLWGLVPSFSASFIGLSVAVVI
jgi:hypothetical protein